VGLRDREGKELNKCAENSRGIAGAAAEACADGNAFVNAERDGKGVAEVC